MKKFLTSMMFSLYSLSAFAVGMPLQGNEYAAKVDSLYNFLLMASLISCVLVFGGMLYFVLRYKRRSDNDDTPYISHNNTLEFLWSFIPFVIFLIVFAWGWVLFSDARTAPKDAFEIHVTGRKWAWDFQYKSGKMTTGEMVVPVGKPVKLIMTSSDVIHSFFIPAFRIKQDVVPSMYTTLWFEADKEGEFQVFCTEYCGAEHSGMLAKIKVLSQEKFEDWLSHDPMKEFDGLSLAERGKLVMDKKACTACHNIDKAGKKIGPSLYGVFGQPRKFTDGSSGVVDANYIRESIKKPNAKMAVGFENGGMNLIPVTDNEITWIVEYIKSTTK